MRSSIFLLEAFEALGTKWYIEVFETIDIHTKNILIQDLENIIISFERKYSRFDKRSILSILNSSRSVPYDKHLAKMLLLARDAFTATDGVFDIFIEDMLVKKGYGESKTINEKSSETVFEINDTTILLSGTKSIDLGGIGKGYLIDLLTKYLQQEMSIECFLINGGGDMYVTHDKGNPVEVYLQNPYEQEVLLGKILLKNQGFCSSSSFVRMWEQRGEKKNHFIYSRIIPPWRQPGDVATPNIILSAC